jgi:hypothetical protein
MWLLDTGVGGDLRDLRFSPFGNDTEVNSMRTDNNLAEMRAKYHPQLYRHATPLFSAQNSPNTVF